MVNTGKMSMLLDTGLSISLPPGEAVDFILYSSIPGALFQENNNFWDVPCENTTRLEFVFGYVFGNKPE